MKDAKKFFLGRTKRTYQKQKCFSIKRRSFLEYFGSLKIVYICQRKKNSRKSVST